MLLQTNHILNMIVLNKNYTIFYDESSSNLDYSNSCVYESHILIVASLCELTNFDPSGLKRKHNFIILC